MPGEPGVKVTGLARSLTAIFPAPPALTNSLGFTRIEPLLTQDTIGRSGLGKELGLHSDCPSSS
jgi:hypothetical protein